MAIDSIPKRQKPLPRSRRQDYNGNTRFSGIPAKEKREEQIRRDDDTVKNVSIKLEDIDKAILYFFENVINPTVIENGNTIKVPIKYGDPEHWKSAQLDGYIRDKKGRMIIPIIMFRRTQMSRDMDIPVNRLNGNVVQTYTKKWDKNNKFDRFSIVNNIIPSKELYDVVLPDYVIISYECSVWTSYVGQMNTIIESLQYWESQYWGDSDSFKFKTKIDSFDQMVEISTENGRIVKGSFTLEIKGFLIPEYIDKKPTTTKRYSTQQIILNTETEIDVLSLTEKDKLAQKIIVTSNKQPAVKSNQTLTDYVDYKFNEMLLLVQYSRNNKVYSNYTVSGSTVSSLSGNSIVTYPSVYTSSAPSGLVSTNEQDFLVFVNGQYMEHDAFSVNQSGSNFVVTASTGSLGYSLESEDEIVVWGKFE